VCGGVCVGVWGSVRGCVGECAWVCGGVCVGGGGSVCGGGGVYRESSIIN
jgi:hypothetical protein